MTEIIKRLRGNKLDTFFATLDTEIDVNYLCSGSEVNSYDDVYDCIDEGNGFDVDVIYYSEAMRYLKENDPSLMESLSIADEMGYQTGNLNSELLASLLASRNAREEFSELEDEIDNFFEELEEWENNLLAFVDLVEYESLDIEDEVLEDFVEFSDLYNEHLEPEQNVEKFLEYLKP